MAYDTYQELVDSVQDYLKEDGLQSQVGDFIILFESVEAAKLRHPYGQTHLTDYSVASAIQTLPADCAAVRSFARAGKPPMTQVPHEQIYVVPNREKYAVLGTKAGQELILPTNAVESPFEAEIVYDTKLGNLVDGVTWLYQHFPMLYVYGTLLQAEPYLEKDQRIATWNALYQGAMNALQTSAASIESGSTQRSGTRTRSRI